MKRTLIHCSYHKCLTVYYKMVVSTMYNKILPYTNGYTHFNSKVDEFYAAINSYRVLSVNNHSLDFDKLGDDFRITRFIRDPRDLVVSGYLYHKKGAEDWCNIVDPGEDDWRVVNGNIPDCLPEGESYSSYLQKLSKEEGLKAEIDFRANHFQSMMQWPVRDERVKLFYYQDIMGHEPDVYEELFSHYGVSWPERKLGRWLGDRFSAKKKRNSTKHIRNPSSGQWREYFTTEVERYFNNHYSDLLDRYNYS